jgi:signal peptidase II
MPIPVQGLSQVMTDRLPDRRFFGFLAAALSVDLVTKFAAGSYLGEQFIPLSQRFALLLIYNTGSAGGYSLGPATWYLNVFVTLLAIVAIAVIARDLGKLHRLGAIALGLIAGGACGNLASMLTGPAGVADFLAVHLAGNTVVFNFADVALWSGALMLVPVVTFLVRAIRADRRAQRRVAPTRAIA